eukprot:UN28832
MMRSLFALKCILKQLRNLIIIQLNKCAKDLYETFYQATKNIETDIKVRNAVEELRANGFIVGGLTSNTITKIEHELRGTFDFIVGTNRNPNIEIDEEDRQHWLDECFEEIGLRIKPSTKLKINDIFLLVQNMKLMSKILKF